MLKSPSGDLGVKKGIVGAIPQNLTVHPWRDELLFNHHHKFMKKKLTHLIPNWDRAKTRQWLMRLTVLKMILLMSLLTTYARVNSQMIISNLKLEEVELSEALERIEELTDYDFVFSYDDVEGYQVSVDLESATLEECLSNLFQELPFTYTTDGDVVIISYRTKQPVNEAEQKKKEIKGKVTDENGIPLPGVSVVVKGTTNGTATDANGDYFISFENENAVLLFSFVGMLQQEITYNGQTDLKIVLKYDTANLDEVVVTGYQVIDRRKLTSAVASVKAEDILVTGGNTIDKMLEGHISGMAVSTNSGEVGAVPKIRIRGTSTLIGNREPLWVIDGIVVSDPVKISPEELNDPDYVNRIGNAISGLNPQDIARIDVLKDASATALYGTKAANGVIVISTKKGHAGKPVVSFNTNNSYKLRPRYSNRNINLMTGRERVNFSRELLNDNYGYSNTVSWVGYEGALRSLYAGEIGYDEFNKKVSSLKNTNTDWFKELTEDSFSSDNTVSVTGGTDNIRYYSSFGYSNNNDVIKDNTSKRYTAILNLDVRFSPAFSTSFAFNANKGKRRYYQDEISPVNYAYNTSRLITPEDNYIVGDGYVYNILNELANSGCKQESNNSTYRINMNFSPKDWLSFNGIFSYTQSNTDINSYWGESTFHASELRRANLGDKIDSEYSELPFGGEYTMNQTRNNSYTARLQSNANKYWGESEQHNINATVGFEMNSDRYKGYVNSTRGYYPERGMQFAVVSPALYPAYANWQSENLPVVSDNLSNVLSFYSSVSYSYKNLFTVNGNMRYDGSNKFGSKSNDNLLPVWSASFSYNLNEHLKSFTGIFDELLLKSSYGYQGNMLSGQSPEMIISKQPYDTHYNEYVSKVSIFPNENLKWERTGSFNLGLEFSMFSHRVMVSSSYYHKETKDAYMQKKISGVNGLSSTVVNGGQIINSGYDVSITAIPVKTENFKWYLSASGSYMDNKVNTLPSAEQYDYTDFLKGTATVKGKSVSSFYSYDFIGLNPNDGGPMFNDLQDKKETLYGIDNYDVFMKVMKSSGRREPIVTGGFNTTLEYKNLRLNANFAYSLGAKTRLFRLYNQTGSEIRPEDNINREMLNRWQHSGDENVTNIPAVIGPDSSAYTDYQYHWSGFTSGQVPTIANSLWEMYDYSDLRVVSADYLKCSSLSLTYSFPESTISHWALSRLETSFLVSNPFILCSSKLKGQTPTQSGFTDIQLSERPAFTLSLSVSF